MIGTVECRVTAHRPNQPLSPIFTYVGSPSNMRIIDVPKGIGQFKVDVVKVVVDYPNNKKEIVEAVRQGSVYVATIPSCEIAGKTTGGVEIICDCTDENGNPVEGFVIGKGDVFVLERDSKFSKLVEKSYVKYVDELPTTPAKGDIVYHNSTLQMFDGTQWLKFGDQEAIDELAERVEALNEEVGQVKDDITSIETKIEDIEGDIVEVKESIPTKTSELENDSITPQSIGAAPIYAPFIRESLTVGQPNMPCVKMLVGDYESGARLDLTVEGGANVGGTINVEGEGAQILINNKQVATIDLINQEIKNPQGLEAGKTLQVVEVEDEPVARGASLQSVSPRATSTHLEWAAVDPITKTSQLDNDSEFVDKDFVNSSIATNTANFKGTFNNESEFPTEATNNDYLFWKTVDENGNTIYKRYKYIASTSTWTYEYTLNNSSFTAEQWATINNGPYAKSEDIPTKTSDLTNDSNFVNKTTLDTEVGKAKYVNGQMWYVSGSEPKEYTIEGVNGEDLTISKMVDAYRSGGFRLTFGAPTLQGDGIWDVANYSTTTPRFITFHNISKDETTGDWLVGTMKLTPVSGQTTRFYSEFGGARIANKSDIPTKTSQLTNDSGFLDGDDKDELNNRIDLIEATSHPNMNVIGSPTFSQGSVGGFSNEDYLMFPTSVNVGNNSVDFHMTFTTGDDVSTQQNILDSWCGLALAIQNGHFILAASSNGTTFNVEEGGFVVEENTPYDIKVSFRYEDDQYIVELGVNDEGSYIVDATIWMDAPLFATPTYWGGANPSSGVSHIFGGTINLNKCWMVWNDEVIWRGYSELPIPTKVSQLDNDVGYVTTEDIPTKVSELENDSEYLNQNGLEPALDMLERPIAHMSDIPTSTSQLENDSGFITSDDVDTKIENIPSITLTGFYDDGTPFSYDVKVNG